MHKREKTSRTKVEEAAAAVAAGDKTEGGGHRYWQS